MARKQLFNGISTVETQKVKVVIPDYNRQAGAGKIYPDGASGYTVPENFNRPENLACVRLSHKEIMVPTALLEVVEPPKSPLATSFVN